MTRPPRAGILSAASFALVSAHGLLAGAQAPPPAPPPPSAQPAPASPAQPPPSIPVPPPSPGPDLPTAPAAVAPVDAASGAPAPAKTEAPPLDPASPAGPKSEKAKLAAKKAELTPLVPKSNDATRPAYQLFAETDLPLLGVGIVLGTARLLRTQKAFCAPLCNPSDLNGLDRVTAGFYDARWGTVSDVGIAAVAAGAGLFLFFEEPIVPALNDGIVIAESGLIATAFSSTLTLAAGRPRPLLYSTKAPLDVRNAPDAGLSFLSSHASVAFALATSTFVTSRRLIPQRGAVFPWVILGGGLGLAGLVAFARVEAGKHFITDSIGGAIVGAAVGVVVPALHGSPVKVIPTVTNKQGSIDLMGMF